MDWGLLLNDPSIAVAAAALVFSVLSFWRQQVRAERHARASVKPLLQIKTQGYIDLKSIKIVNRGIGPAVIISAAFSRGDGGDATSRIVELFNLDIIWESYMNIPEGRAVPAEEEMVLVVQSARHLIANGMKEESAIEILKEWQRQKSGIRVHVEYSDIYGNEMEPLAQTLK